MPKCEFFLQECSHPCQAGLYRRRHRNQGNSFLACAQSHSGRVSITANFRLITSVMDNIGYTYWSRKFRPKAYAQLKRPVPDWDQLDSLQWTLADSYEQVHWVPAVQLYKNIEPSHVSQETWMADQAAVQAWTGSYVSQEIGVQDLGLELILIFTLTVTIFNS